MYGRRELRFSSTLPLGDDDERLKPRTRRIHRAQHRTPPRAEGTYRSPASYCTRHTEPEPGKPLEPLIRCRRLVDYCILLFRLDERSLSGFLRTRKVRVNVTRGIYYAVVRAAGTMGDPVTDRLARKSRVRRSVGGRGPPSIDFKASGRQGTQNIYNGLWPAYVRNFGV